jgi:hypothetical protein
MEKPSPVDAIEQTAYVRIMSETEFKESMTGDGDYEITFGGVATLAMTPDAAEKLFWMIGTRFPSCARSQPNSALPDHPLAGFSATNRREMSAIGR